MGQEFTSGIFVDNKSRLLCLFFFFFFSSRRRHTRSLCDWSSDVCSSDLIYRDGRDDLIDIQQIKSIVDQCVCIFRMSLTIVFPVKK